MPNVHTPAPLLVTGSNAHMESNSRYPSQCLSAFPTLMLPQSDLQERFLLLQKATAARGTVFLIPGGGH
eukprot:m.90304 g.90304  ORF g.90304 m.90304 type:complete len:69 (+) comp51094_c0_seq2:189-395(+)